LGSVITHLTPKAKLYMEKYQQIRDLIVSSEGDFDKFYNKGNKAAGTRVRKAMQDLKELAQAIRIDVQGQKNG
jgi:hypothetical protein